MSGGEGIQNTAPDYAPITSFMTVDPDTIHLSTFDNQHYGPTYSLFIQGNQVFLWVEDQITSYSQIIDYLAYDLRHFGEEKILILEVMPIGDVEEVGYGAGAAALAAGLAPDDVAGLAPDDVARAPLRRLKFQVTAGRDRVKYWNKCENLLNRMIEILTTDNPTNSEPNAGGGAAKAPESSDNGGGAIIRLRM